MTPDLFSPASYTFSPYAAPTLLTAIAILSFGLIVLIREWRSRVSFSFFIMTSAAATWLLSYSLMYCARTESAAAWAFGEHLGITLIPASVYHFTVGTLQIYPKHKSRVWLTWLISAVFLMTVLLTDSFISGVYLYWWGYYARYRWLSVPFLIFFFWMMTLSLRHYWFEYRGTAPGIGRKEAKHYSSLYRLLDITPAFAAGRQRVGPKP